MSASLSAKIRAEIGRNVYGEGARGAVYYHGGHYYDGDGGYCYSNPGTRPPPGAVAKQAQEDGEPGNDSDEQPSDPQNPREVALTQLTVTQLQKLQRTAGVLEENVIKGEGARVKLIAWLLENTAE